MGFNSGFKGLTSQTTDSIYRRLYSAKGSWTGSTNWYHFFIYFIWLVPYWAPIKWTLLNTVL